MDFCHSLSAFARLSAGVSSFRRAGEKSSSRREKFRRSRESLALPLLGPLFGAASMETSEMAFVMLCKRDAVNVVVVVDAVIAVCAENLLVVCKLRSSLGMFL